MSGGCGPKLATIVGTYNGRIVMPIPLLNRYNRELPDGAKHIVLSTVKRAMRGQAHVEVVSRRIEGEGNRQEIIGYKSIRIWKHPASHAYDAVATMTKPQVGIMLAVTGGILLLALQGAKYLLTGGFE